MIRKTLMSFVLILSIAFAVWPTAALAAPTNTPTVKIYPIGDPIWTPVDFHLLSVPIGTAETGFAEFFETVQLLLPPPNHLFHPALGIGPGAPHQPPYTSELAEGIATMEYHEGHIFKQDEFSSGMGVLLTWMNIPDPGTTGSSPDFTSGSIIPNTLFPIDVEGKALHNNKLFDPYLSTQVPALDENLDPPFFVEGHSHFPMFIVTNADWGPQGVRLVGSYLYTLDLVDTSGNGWHIEARFTVVP